MIVDRTHFHLDNPTGMCLRYSSSSSATWRNGRNGEIVEMWKLYRSRPAVLGQPHSSNTSAVSFPHHQNHRLAVYWKVSQRIFDWHGSRREGRSLAVELSDNPRLLESPIDAAEYLRTSMLCMNRLLGEKGVCRMIVGFHKDLTSFEVAARLTHVADDRASLLADPLAVMQEVAGYIRYFSGNDGFILYVLICLTRIAGEVIETVQQAIDATLMDLLMVTIGSRSEELTHYFVALLAILLLVDREGTFQQEELRFTGDDWRNNAIDRVLNAGFADYILLTADMQEPPYNTGHNLPGHIIPYSLVSFIYYHMEDRPLNPHYDIRNRFLDAARRLAAQMEEHQGLADFLEHEENPQDPETEEVDEEEETRKGFCCFWRKTK